MGQADAQATFAVNLEDGTTDNATRAEQALARLKRQLEGDTAAMNAMQKAMRNLKGGTAAQISLAKDLEVQLKGKKEAVASTTASILALGGSLNKPKGDPLKKVTTMLEQLQGAASKVGGPFGSFIGQLGNVRDIVVKGALAFGIVAVAAAITAVTVATAAATAALLKYGIAQSNARRAEKLRLEGLTKMRSWMGIAAGTASELQTAIDQASGSTALGRDKTAQYAEQLYKMGLRGQNLSDALEGVAIKAAVQGDAQAQMFAQWAAGANLTGRSVKKLTDDVKARLGGIAARQMLDLDVQATKLRENLSRMFDGLKLEAFLKGLDTVTRMLGQQSATGRALKVMFETLFQPMLDQLTGATPLVKRFFQGIVIGALVVGIGVLKLRNAFRRTFGDVSLFKGLDGGKLALYAGLAAVSLLTGAVVALGVVMGLLLSPILAVGATIYGLYSSFKRVYDFVASMEWGKLGTSIAEGIGKGIQRGAKWVIDTIRGLGASAMAAFKGVLGIASPSKVFAKLGLALPEGLEVGMQRGQPKVQRAAEGLVDIPTYPKFPTEPRSSAPPTLSGVAAARSSAPSLQVTIEELNVTATGDKPADFAHDLRRELADMLEQLLAEMGGALPRAQ